MRINKNKIKPFVMLMVFFSLYSCKDNSVFNEKKEINGDWQITDLVCFKVDINDLESNFDIFIKIDIKEDFLTENIWLFVNSTSPSGNILRDTVSYFVCDKTGKWLGKKHGKIIKNKFLYKANIRFPEKGTYTFCIKHGMREKDLPKIQSIGLETEKTNRN